MNSNLNINYKNIKHLEFIYGLIRNFNDLPLNIKGGSALLFAYGSNRFTTDIDLDAPYRINLKNRIKEFNSINHFNISDVIQIKKKNNSDEYKIFYSYKNKVFFNKLKIDYSFREPNFNKLNYIFKNNVRFADLKYIFNNKIIALQEKNKFSHLYDLFFISYKYPFILNKNDLNLLNNLLEKPKDLLTLKLINSFVNMQEAGKIKFLSKDFNFYKDFLQITNNEEFLLEFLQKFNIFIKNLNKNYQEKQNIFFKNLSLSKNDYDIMNLIEENKINSNFFIDYLKNNTKFQLNSIIIKSMILKNPNIFELLEKEKLLNKYDKSNIDIINIKNKALTNLYSSNIFQNDKKIEDIINLYNDIFNYKII